MTTYEAQSKIAGYIIAAAAATIIVILIAVSQSADEADNQAARVQAVGQQKQAAQVEAWARIDQNFNGGGK